MSGHLQVQKLELLHNVSNLIDRAGLWTEIARLGMTREFIESRENFFSRIIMELDLIEKQAPAASIEARKLRSCAAALSLQEKKRPDPHSDTRVA